MSATRCSAWFAIALACCGCGPSKNAECNRFIGMVNANAPRLKEASEKVVSSSDARAADEFKGTTDKLADETQSLGLKDETLKSYAAEYGDMVRKLGAAAREFRGPDSTPPVRAKAADDLASIEPQQRDLATKINSYCGAK